LYIMSYMKIMLKKSCCQDFYSACISFIKPPLFYYPMKNFVSIVIPVYNEERAIAPTISKIKQVMSTTKWKYEIIAVNDGSRDRSVNILKKISGIKLISHGRNRGYGSSLKTGIRHAESEQILITDADGTYPLETIPRLLEQSAHYDMVIGARDKKKIPLVRRPAKWVIGQFANFLTGHKIPDLNSGLRIFNKELAMQFWSLYPEGFSFTTTITMAFLTSRYEVRFSPITYHERKGRSSIHPIRDTIGFIQLVFRLTLYFNPLKVFLPLAGIFFVLAAARAIRDILVTPEITIGSLAIILFVMSFQLFFFGLIADIINKK